MLLWFWACSSTPAENTGEPWVMPSCPTYAQADAAPQVQNEELTELSGLARSARAPDVLWAHNDSGDSARLFALRTDGSSLGSVSLTGVTALDWEDLTMERGEHPALWVGDIGDNAEFRPNIQLHRLDEPDPSALPATATAESYTLSFPDGAHNAEALVWDPLDARLYLFTKAESGLSGMWQVPDLEDEGRVLEQVALLDLMGPSFGGSPLITGGEVSPDGSLLLLRTYTHIWGFRRDPSQPLSAALRTPVCQVAAAVEPQGEAVTWIDGVYVTISEGESPHIFTFEPK